MAPRYLAANEMSIEAGIWPNQMLIEEEMDGSPEVSVSSFVCPYCVFLCEIGRKNKSSGLFYTPINFTPQTFSVPLTS